MKKLLTILSLSVGFIAKGQTSDTLINGQIYRLDIDPGMQVKNTWPVGSYPIGIIKMDTSYIHRTPQKEFDTVKVYMLLTDSTRGFFNLPRQPIAWSDYGYEVNKFIPAGWDNYDNQHGAYWEHQKYLDDKKQPLGKNTVVWMVRENK